MKSNRFNALRGLLCAVLLLPLLGMSLPTAYSFWWNVGETAVIPEAATVAAVNNHPPVATPVEGETYAGVYIELPLSATDADNDPVILKLVDAPKLGTATIEEGVLKYTPADGKTGTDKFTYAAVDTLGNTSEPAQIKIKIRKNSAKLTYADMEGNPAHLAALCLSEQGVMTGEKIGASYFFHPDYTVTRSEFIAMASVLAGLPVEETTQTDFADDAGLSPWAKGYISAAADTGLISGYLTSSGAAEIRGGNMITAAEASVIVSNLLTEDLDVPLETAAMGQSMAPAWAATATARLTAAEVLPKEAQENAQQKITRQTACEMLYRTMLLMNA